MASKRIPIDIDLNTRDAQRRVKELSKELENTDDGLTDVESAGKRMAKALEAAADDAIAEIDSTADAVRALEQALGDDFDADTREVVADLKALGLTAEDIEQDADELARALRRTGDVEVHATSKGFDDVGQAVGRVRDETGRAKDSMHGFIGGTVGELPLISDAMGPVGEGLGQLTEGALEGEIGFKQLAVAGLAIGGIAIVMDRVNKKLEKAARVDAFKAEQVEAYEDALSDADSTLEAIISKLEDSDGLMLNLLGDGIDVTGILTELGLDVQHTAQLIEGGTESIEEWKAAMESAGLGGKELEAAVIALNEEHKSYVKATEGAAVAAQFFTSSTEDATEATDDSTESTEAATGAAEDHENALSELERQQERNVRALDRQKAATDALHESTMAAISSDYAYRSSTDAVEDAMRDLFLTTQDTEASQEDLDDALFQAEGAMLGQADAAVRLADDQARANGQTLTAKNRTRIYRDELARLRDSVGANSPLGRQIQSHIDQLNRIPTSITTRVNTVLGNTEGRVFVNGRAGGGDVEAGSTHLVGEQGPELVTFGADARVHSNADSKKMLSSGHTFHIEQHFDGGDRDTVYSAVAGALGEVMWRAKYV